jgi:hypothetical protein
MGLLVRVSLSWFRIFYLINLSTNIAHLPLQNRFMPNFMRNPQKRNALWAAFCPQGLVQGLFWFSSHAAAPFQSAVISNAYRAACSVAIARPRVHAAR